MGVVLKRALYFLTCNGKMMYPTKIEQDIFAQSTSCRGKTAAYSRTDELQTIVVI